MSLGIAALALNVLWYVLGFRRPFKNIFWSTKTYAKSLIPKGNLKTSYLVFVVFTEGVIGLTHLEHSDARSRVKMFVSLYNCASASPILLPRPIERALEGFKESMFLHSKNYTSCFASVWHQRRRLIKGRQTTIRRYFDVNNYVLITLRVTCVWETSYDQMTAPGKFIVGVVTLRPLLASMNNSLVPVKTRWDICDTQFGVLIFNLVMSEVGISNDIVSKWLPLNLTDDKSILVQIVAWCRKATSHYPSQCWPSSMPSLDQNK